MHLGIEFQHKRDFLTLRINPTERFSKLHFWKFCSGLAVFHQFHQHATLKTRYGRLFPCVGGCFWNTNNIPYNVKSKIWYGLTKLTYALCLLARTPGTAVAIFKNAPKPPKSGIGGPSCRLNVDCWTQMKCPTMADWRSDVVWSRWVLTILQWIGGFAPISSTAL